MNPIAFLRSYAYRTIRWMENSNQRALYARIYDRYSDATMIRKDRYIDNLEIANIVKHNPLLTGLSIVECGTWRGGMAAGLIEVCGSTRPYHFFDSFEGLPLAQQIDGEAARHWQADTESPSYYNNCSASESEFRDTIVRTGIDLNRIHIHKGFFNETVFAADVGKIALLRLDGDWYESTMCCLNAFFPKIANGGYLVIDDYGTWDGCTKAVHEYLSTNLRPEPMDRHGQTGVTFLKVKYV